jgi:hypothetical protein
MTRRRNLVALLIRNMKRGNHPQHRVLMRSNRTRPYELWEAVIERLVCCSVVDGVFDGAGEADGVWGFGFPATSLGARRAAASSVNVRQRYIRTASIWVISSWSYDPSVRANGSVRQAQHARQHREEAGSR